MHTQPQRPAGGALPPTNGLETLDDLEGDICDLARLSHAADRIGVLVRQEVRACKNLVPSVSKFMVVLDRDLEVLLTFVGDVAVAARRLREAYYADGEDIA